MHIIEVQWWTEWFLYKKHYTALHSPSLRIIKYWCPWTHSGFIWRELYDIFYYSLAPRLAVLHPGPVLVYVHLYTFDDHHDSLPYLHHGTVSSPPWDRRSLLLPPSRLRESPPRLPASYGVCGGGSSGGGRGNGACRPRTCSLLLGHPQDQSLGRLHCPWPGDRNIQYLSLFLKYLNKEFSTFAVLSINFEVEGWEFFTWIWILCFLQFYSLILK